MVVVLGVQSLHSLGNDLTGHCTNIVEVCIPQLNRGLNLEPPETNQQTEDYTASVLLATSPFGGLDDLGGDEATVGVCQDTLIDFTADDLFNLVFQPQSNFRDLLGGVRRLWLISNV